jgi:hypothetical protein
VGVVRVRSEVGKVVDGVKEGVKVVEVADEGGCPLEGSAMESAICGGYGRCCMSCLVVD